MLRAARLEVTPPNALASTSPEDVEPARFAYPFVYVTVPLTMGVRVVEVFA